MPFITVQNLHSKTIDCQSKKERLLDILLAHTDWMHACGGKGRCTTCRAEILDGQSSLDERTPAEQKFFDAGKLKQNERLTCQVQVSNDDLIIKVPESSKLPHLSYSE
jgi:2Fe-2S ferredoxin